MSEEYVIRIDDAIDGDKVKEVNVYFEDKYDDNWEITEGDFNGVKIVCANHEQGC